MLVVRGLGVWGLIVLWMILMIRIRMEKMGLLMDVLIDLEWVCLCCLCLCRLLFDFVNSF